MNNINIQEVKRFVAAIEKDPAQAKKAKCVTGSWVLEEGKPQFISTVKYPKGSILLQSELPSFAGGWGTSPDPIQYCLYGLAACFAVTFVATATSEGVELKRFEVSAEKVKFTVHAEGASRETLEKILKLAEERCPGTECLTQKIPLEVELKT